MNHLKDRLNALLHHYVGKWYVTLERAVPRSLLEQQLADSSIPSFGFYFMLSLSAVIATLGLVANSPATIIGAMIIAPLMSPIVTLSFGLVTLDWKLSFRSSLTLVTGVFWTVCVAYLTVAIIGTRLVGSEIVSRSNPTLLDLGVALAAGAAGAFAMTRKNIGNALPGVAISVALVPPLCVVGAGLALGQDFSPIPSNQLGGERLATGAMLLFLTNLIGIIFCGSLVFLANGYANFKRAFLGIVASVFSVFLLAFPLSFSLEELLVRNQIYHDVRSFVDEFFPEWEDRVHSLDFSVNVKGKSVFIEADSLVQDDLEFKDGLVLLRDALSQSTGKDVYMKVRVLPFRTVEVAPLDLDKNP